METIIIVICVIVAVLLLVAVLAQVFKLVKRISAANEDENANKDVCVLEITQKGKTVYIECNGIEEESSEQDVEGNKS